MVKKRVVQKAAEATGVLVGNKIVDKIISVGKTKSKEKGEETNKKQEIYIPPEKNTANYRWLKIVLTPYKYRIPKKL